jgi:hypothetical protein
MMRERMSSWKPPTNPRHTPPHPHPPSARMPRSIVAQRLPQRGVPCEREEALRCELEVYEVDWGEDCVYTLSAAAKRDGMGGWGDGGCGQGAYIRGSDREFQRGGYP